MRRRSSAFSRAKMRLAHDGGLERLVLNLDKGTLRRPVIVVGPIALKTARNECGRACNRYEAQLYRNTTPHRRALLCPVLWASPRGFLLVMRAAVPLSDMMSPEEYHDAVKRWDYMPGEDGCPFEPKASDWGWYNGCRVALDYSTPAWGND
jgi:hypothetical protein